MNKKKYQAPEVENCRGGILCCGHIQLESASLYSERLDMIMYANHDHDVIEVFG